MAEDAREAKSETSIEWSTMQVAEAGEPVDCAKKRNVKSARQKKRSVAKGRKNCTDRQNRRDKELVRRELPSPVVQMRNTLRVRTGGMFRWVALQISAVDVMTTRMTEKISAATWMTRMICMAAVEARDAEARMGTQAVKTHDLRVSNNCTIESLQPETDVWWVVPGSRLSSLSPQTPHWRARNAFAYVSKSKFPREATF